MCIRDRFWHVPAAYTAVIGTPTDHVRGSCTAVYTVCTRPWAAAYTGRKHGHVQTTRPCRCTLYTAVDALCTRPLNAGVVHPVNGHVHGNIHGTYTAVHTGRKHDRLHGRKHGRVHGHGRTMYMARAQPCTQSVHGRPRPCTNCVHGRTRAMHMVRPCPEHGRVRSRYVPKHGRVRGP